MRALAVRWRLTAAFAAVMAVVLTATGLFVYQRQATNLDQTIDRALRARAADVAALAQQSDSGLSDARPPGGRANRAELAQLIDASGHVLDRTPGLPARPLLTPAAITAARRGATVVIDARLVGDQPVRLLAEPVRAQDQKLVIIVGQSLEERNLALRDLRGVLLVGGPIALMLASIAGYLLTGAALRPVEMMRRQAANISATDLDQQLPAGGNDELGRLSRTLNEMLTRIHASVERERTLVSDASHELRTPLGRLACGGARTWQGSPRRSASVRRTGLSRNTIHRSPGRLQLGQRLGWWFVHAGASADASPARRAAGRPWDQPQTSTPAADQPLVPRAFRRRS